MNSWIEITRILVSLTFLTYSSWQDVKKREVSNKVWLIFAPAGLSLSLLEALLRTEESFRTLLAISIVVTTGLSFALFYLGFFGGADAKALICLSLAMPVHPSVLRTYLGLSLPIFPLSVLINAAFASSMLVFGIIVYNILHYLKAGGRFFEGLEDESSLRKLLLFITGIKIDLDRIKDNIHFIPLETVSEEDGRIIHHLHLFPHIADENLQHLASLRGFSGKIEDGIWVTPAIPFLIFVTVGFFVAVFLGDIPIWLVFSLLSLVS